MFESEILIEAVRLGYRCVAVAIGVLPRAEARASYFLPVVDIARITIMVGGKAPLKGHVPGRPLPFPSVPSLDARNKCGYARPAERNEAP